MLYPLQDPPGKAVVPVNGVQQRKRVTQVASSVMPSGAAVKGADVIRVASPDPLATTPEGHEDTNPNYDRVRGRPET